MPFLTTDFPGIRVFEPAVFEDDRGYFFESYNKEVFEKAGITNHFVQDNQSSSVYGVIRGLHYQLPPYAQAKLVRVLYGRILDVAMDIRIGSPTYRKVFSIELSEENKKHLFIPPGFAHGFSVLSEKATMIYKCDNLYNKKSEAGIRYDDPGLSIDWQIPTDKQVVSNKDKELPLFADCRNMFEFPA